MDWDFSITNGIVSSEIYDKQDYFNFEIVYFSFLDKDVPRSHSCGVYISQHIRFARAGSNVGDLNNILTAKLLKQGYQIIKFLKHFLNSTTYTQSCLLKCNIGFKTILQQSIWDPVFL